MAHNSKRRAYVSGISKIKLIFWVNRDRDLSVKFCQGYRSFGKSKAIDNLSRSETRTLSHKDLDCMLYGTDGMKTANEGLYQAVLRQSGLGRNQRRRHTRRTHSLKFFTSLWVRSMSTSGLYL